MLDSPKSTKNGNSAFNSCLALILSYDICQTSMHALFANYLSISISTTVWLRQ